MFHTAGFVAGRSEVTVFTWRAVSGHGAFASGAVPPCFDAEGRAAGQQAVIR